MQQLFLLNQVCPIIYLQVQKFNILLDSFEQIILIQLNCIQFLSLQ